MVCIMKVKVVKCDRPREGFKNLQVAKKPLLLPHMQIHPCGSLSHADQTSFSLKILIEIWHSISTRKCKAEIYISHGQV